MTSQLKRALASALGGTLSLYERFCASTSDISLDMEAQRALDKSQPTVLVCWHEESQLLSFVAASLPTPVSCIANDTFGGELMANAAGRLGVVVHVLKGADTRAEKLTHLREAVALGVPVAIAADYGEPWFKARPTALQVAAATGARLFAVHVTTPRRWRLGRGAHVLAFPTPWNIYRVVARHVVAEPTHLNELQSALDGMTA